MNVSPGVIMLTKDSSISPRLPAFAPASLTFSSGISTIVPMFMRASRAIRSDRTSTRPSASRNSLR